MMIPNQNLPKMDKQTQIDVNDKVKKKIERKLFPLNRLKYDHFKRINMLFKNELKLPESTRNSSKQESALDLPKIPCRTNSDDLLNQQLQQKVQQYVAAQKMQLKEEYMIKKEYEGGRTSVKGQSSALGNFIRQLESQEDPMEIVENSDSKKGRFFCINRISQVNDFISTSRSLKRSLIKEIIVESSNQSGARIRKMINHSKIIKIR